MPTNVRNISGTLASADNSYKSSSVYKSTSFAIHAIGDKYFRV